MCFVISIVLLIFSYRFYETGNATLGTISVVVALFFIYMMIKNITNIKKRKENDN